MVRVKTQNLANATILLPPFHSHNRLAFIRHNIPGNACIQKRHTPINRCISPFQAQPIIEAHDLSLLSSRGKHVYRIHVGNRSTRNIHFVLCGLLFSIEPRKHFDACLSIKILLSRCFTLCYGRTCYIYMKWRVWPTIFFETRKTNKVAYPRLYYA